MPSRWRQKKKPVGLVINGLKSLRNFDGSRVATGQSAPPLLKDPKRSLSVLSAACTFTMKSSRRGRARSSFSAGTVASYTYQNEHPAPDPPIKITEIPITSTSDGDDDHEPSPPPSSQVPISVHPASATTESLSQEKTAALVKIQSAYRSYMVRKLVKKMSAVNSEANYWERLIQRQETVDAVRSSERERIKINEALMALLLKLDSVPGVDPAVRELRRHLSRRIVGLQEILDAVSDTRIENWDWFLRDWDDVIAKMEKDVCDARGGGHEMERFCAEYLGFHCLQRFLRDQ